MPADDHPQAYHQPAMTADHPAGASRPKTVLVDARGLNCPLPLLEARRALQVLPPATVLIVLATDPAAPADFADFALARDLELDEERQDDGSFRLTLRQPER
jgi:tRNA 2-thiouridine synthesizing protein A